jgi:hypothetical protein
MLFSQLVAHTATAVATFAASDDLGCIMEVYF